MVSETDPECLIYNGRADPVDASGRMCRGGSEWTDRTGIEAKSIESPVLQKLVISILDRKATTLKIKRDSSWLIPTMKS